MPPNLSRPQQQGLILVSALILGALFFFHWWGAKRSDTGADPNPSGRRKIFIELAGAVQRPGLFAYEQAPTVSRVLEDGGGLTGDGRLSSSETGEVLTGETRLTLAIDPQRGLSLEKSPLSVRALWILGRPIPVNLATAEELDWLPGIGPGLAQRIVERRETVGPFVELDELQQVSGIGEKTLEKLRPYLTAP